LGGAISDLTGRGDEMAYPPAHKESTDEQVDLTVGNTEKYLEASEKIIIQDTTCREGYMASDYGAKLNKGDS
jgi:hypothetical protein